MAHSIYINIKISDLAVVCIGSWYSLAVMRTILFFKCILRNQLFHWNQCWKINFYFQFVPSVSHTVRYFSRYFFVQQIITYYDITECPTRYRTRHFFNNFPLMRILQRNLKRTHLIVLEMWRHHNMCCSNLVATESHSAEHATHTGWHKRTGTFEMRSSSERMHTWRKTPSIGRNFQTLIIWITVS